MTPIEIAKKALVKIAFANSNLLTEDTFTAIRALGEITGISIGNMTRQESKAKILVPLEAIAKAEKGGPEEIKMLTDCLGSLTDYCNHNNNTMQKNGIEKMGKFMRKNGYRIIKLLESKPGPTDEDREKLRKIKQNIDTYPNDYSNDDVWVAEKLEKEWGMEDES